MLLSSPFGHLAALQTAAIGRRDACSDECDRDD